jgi:hypothetical protein
MLIRNIIKDTLSWQGFRVEIIDRYKFGIDVKIVADQRYKPRCGQCGCLGQYRDTRAERHFKHVHLWGIFWPDSSQVPVVTCCPVGYFGWPSGKIVTDFA